MRIDKRIATAIVFVVLTMLSSQMASAGECDFCVCKGKDTINSCTKCCTASQTGAPAVTELKLKVSDDGKSIVDQNGEVIARFTEGTRVRIKAKAEKTAAAEKTVTAEKTAAAEKSATAEKSVTQNQKMQGCFKCRQECLIWEGNKCVKWIRTCDWDFDCK